MIKATSMSAYISEGKDEKNSWYLNPKLRPDVFTMTKTTKSTTVTFKTDIDSLKMKLKPGQSYDFIVLLGDSDSCYTRIVCPLTKNYASRLPRIHDTIPFVLSPFNNIIVKSIVNDTDTIYLKFDTGTNGFLLTKETLVKKVDVASLENNKFQIGNQIWQGQEIFPVLLSGQGSDGRFGWNIFDGMIVEIDYDKLLFIVHSILPKITEGFQKFDIQYSHTLFCIKGTMKFKHKQYKSSFLFDNGYQRTLMLDETIMQSQNYPKSEMEVINKTFMHNGQGKEIPVITVNNESFYLGKFLLRNVPVQLMTSSNPAHFNVHIMGNEVLKRFNTILDFQKNKIYLKPNRLYDEFYADGKK